MGWVTSVWSLRSQAWRTAFWASRCQGDGTGAADEMFGLEFAGVEEGECDGIGEAGSEFLAERERLKCS